MDTFSIVFICTGNRFRSPLAEAFVRRLTQGFPVTTESCGTLEIARAPALPEAREIAFDYGIDLSGHRTRHVTDLPLERADLVLGFEEAHVMEAVVDAKAPRQVTFTVRELDRLLIPGMPSTADPISRARQLVQELDGLRASQPRVGSEDFPDPFGGSASVYRNAAAEIRELSVMLVAKLFGVTDSRSLPRLPLRHERPRALLWRR